MMNLMFIWAAWPIFLFFFYKEVSVTKKSPGGLGPPSICICVQIHTKTEHIIIATCSMYKNIHGNISYLLVNIFLQHSVSQVQEINQAF